jgi:hypothetical protein
MAGREINRRFRKTPCRLRGEKRVAAGGEEPVGGPDEIKRRDTLEGHSEHIQDLGLKDPFRNQPG